MDAFLRIVGEWLYLMIDEKENGALVKVGLTSMTLRKRFSGYKTSNPFLICAGVCQVRCNQDLCTVEEMYHQFMENNEFFVINFFDEEYRKALSIMGTKSGRDADKDKLSGLTPISHNETTIYKEAKLTLVCKKIYQHDMVLENIPQEAVETYYKEESPHTMYIGEVIEVIKN